MQRDGGRCRGDSVPRRTEEHRGDGGRDGRPLQAGGGKWAGTPRFANVHRVVVRKSEAALCHEYVPHELRTKAPGQPDNALTAARPQTTGHPLCWHLAAPKESREEYRVNP